MTGPLARVFINLGYASVRDSKGRSLYLVIIDQHLAAHWLLPLLSKDTNTICSMVCHKCVPIEKFDGMLLTLVRVDNGTEFINANYGAYLRVLHRA